MKRDEKKSVSRTRLKTRCNGGTKACQGVMSTAAVGAVWRSARLADSQQREGVSKTTAPTKRCWPRQDQCRFH